jgi:crotonobetainyl-CoA:carnitine CoA-transferase CaiB-like acyl-CoA transferase
MSMTVQASDPKLNGVLEGMPVTVGSRSGGARVAAALLADLGADVQDVSDGPADIADLDAPKTDSGITLSAFGPTGAYRDAVATDNTVLAVGGTAMAQWSYRPGPVHLVTPFPSASQGILSAIAVTARRLCADLEGCDVPDHVSALHSLFSINSGAYVWGENQDPHRWRHTPRGQWPSYATYQTNDGEWLFVGASTTVFMIKLLQALGLDDVLADPNTHNGPRALTDEVGTGIWKRIADVFATGSREEWMARINEVGVPVGPVLTIEDALAHPQVASQGFVSDDGRLQNLVRVNHQPTGGQPRPASGTLPLSGLRVLEVTGYIAGSYTGRLLADLGADVVKVEAPGGDPFRTTGYGFASWNYGKRGMVLDLTTEEGRNQVLDMASRADIFVTNYRAASLQKFGLTREALVERNPALIHCVISAFGEGGPLSHLPGFDPIVQGFVGVMRRQGGDDDPVKSQMAATDYMSAMLATLGVVSARYRQLQTGGAYSVSTCLLAGAMALIYDAMDAIREGRPYSRGGRDYEGPGGLDHLYEVQDGWIYAAGPQPGTLTDEAAALAYLGGPVREDTREGALARLQELGLAAFPAVHPEELTQEPHSVANGYWTHVDQPELGELTLPAPVLRKDALTRHAPLLGETPDLSDWMS